MYGFYQHCRLDKACLECLLCDVDAIKTEAFRKRWVQMAMIAASKSGEEQHVAGVLGRMDWRGKLEQWQKELGSKKMEIWDITTRNIKKHKYYRYVPADFKGVINDYCGKSAHTQTATSSAPSRLSS